ncbi:MAG: DUF1934 domain-containing protein [Saccharofermentanales bacterium]
MFNLSDLNKDAIIQLESNQWTDGQASGPIRLTTVGHLAYERKNDIWSVSYDESDATGMRGTRTRVSLFPNGRVVLSRTGSVEMELEFVKGDQRVEAKSTPYGPVRFSVLTHEVKGKLSEEGGAIELGYSLGFENRHTVSTKLQLEVTARDPRRDEGDRGASQTGFKS